MATQPLHGNSGYGFEFGGTKFISLPPKVVVFQVWPICIPISFTFDTASSVSGRDPRLVTLANAQTSEKQRSVPLMIC